MANFDADGVAYRVRRMSAAEQWALWRLLTPILPALSGIDVGARRQGLGFSTITSLLEPLMRAADIEFDDAVTMCLEACEQWDGDAWKPASRNLRFTALVGVLIGVASHNFGPLVAMKRAKFDRVPQIGGSYEPVRMPSGEDWLYRPFMRGKCRYVELHDGTLQIHDVAKINDLLDVSDENEARARRAAEKS